MLEEACFLYYWEGADPQSGMARESIPGDDRIVATGAIGMGIATMIVGADRGFITRVQAVERLTSIVNFLDSSCTFLNKPLARLYGMEAGIDSVGGELFRKVKITDPNRGGLLGMGSVLALRPRRTHSALVDSQRRL